MQEKRYFIKASIILSMFFAVLSAAFIAFYFYLGIELFNFVLIFSSMVLLILAILILFCIMVLIKNNSMNTDSEFVKLSYYIAKHFIYPMIMPFSGLLGMEKEQIERFFIELNNEIVECGDKCFESKDIILLLPHCLQDSQCNTNISHDLNNCRRCGRCDIKDLIELAEKYGITPLVVTGGTAAREYLKKKNPSAVIAVACERDLSSGIIDSDEIPVIGILNERPEGPCKNTRVDLEKIEGAIQRFLKCR